MCVVNYSYPATCRDPKGHGSDGWLLQVFPISHPRAARHPQQPPGYYTVLVGLPDLLLPSPPKKIDKKTKERETFCPAHARAHYSFILSTSSDASSDIPSTSISPSSPTTGASEVFSLFSVLIFYFYPTTCGPKGHGSGGAAA